MADNKDKAQDSKQQDAGTDRDSGFVASPPEANVFPSGAAQADRGSAGGPAEESKAGRSAAGTPDEGRLGGSGGTSASGTTGNDPDR